MTTITVLITADLALFINREVSEGNAESKAHVVRTALQFLREKRAFDRIREAQDDIHEGRVYKGDLGMLLQSIPG